MGAVSLKELSAYLGLSQRTVSRVLSGYCDVSARTREKVQKAARELGYRPLEVPASPGVRRFDQGHAGAVGIVLPSGVRQMSDPYFLEFVAAVGEALSKAHMDMMVTAAHMGDDEMSLYQHLISSGKVDGLIVVRTRQDDQRINFLRQNKFPFVAYGRTRDCSDFAWLDVDGEQGFFDAACRLLALGHTRIAMINAPEKFNFSHLRLAGFRRAMAERGRSIDEGLIVEGDMSEQAGYHAFFTLIEKPNPPTAILCANDSMAMGVLRALRQSKLVAGRDIAVIGYDDLPVSAYASPPLTTIRQPLQSAGVKVAEMMVALLSGENPRNLQVLWMPELVVRHSDGPPLK